MRHYVYLITDRDGCSPLLAIRPLPWRLLRELPGFLVLPRGSYVRLEHALAVCEEIEAVEEELAAERTQPG
jgi:hypothetical protein